MGSAAASARWREKNKDKVNAYAKTWRSRHLGERAKYADSTTTESQHDSNLRNKYGIGRDIYDLLLDMQGGGCAICGREVCVTGRRLGVDHCHTTGRIRGVLCGCCNVAIARLRDDPALARAAAEYLSSRKAAV